MIVELDTLNSKVRIELQGSYTDDENRANIITLSIGDYKNQDDLSGVVGKVILNSLRTLAGQPNLDAEAANVEFMKRVVEPKAIAGDADAQQVLANFYEGMALQDKNPLLLEDAEFWHKQVGALGVNDAAHFVNSIWPKRKLELLNIINGKVK